MAAMLKREINIEASVVQGSRREFQVLVGEQVVAKKGWLRFPKDETVLSAVKQTLAACP